MIGSSGEVAVAKLKMLSISVAYLVVEFTLAILGWGGFLSFFSRPQFLALAILTIGLTAASFFSGASISTGVKEDRSNRWVIGALSLIGLLLAFFSAYTDRLGLLVFGGNTLRWVGVVLFTVLLILGLVFGPILEESFFRGCLLPTLALSTGTVPAVIITGVVFAVFHGPVDLAHWVTLTATGIAYGWMRLASRSTTASALMHSAYNLTLYFFYFFVRS